MTTQPLGIILDQPIVEDPPHNASGRTSRWDPVAQAVKAATEPASDSDPTPVQIVQTVTAAEDDDIDPVVAVVDRYGVSRPRARILIDKARKAGLL